MSSTIRGYSRLALEELRFWSVRVIRGVMLLVFLQWDELVAQLSGLAFDLLFEPFVTLGIPGSPDGFVVFDLFGNNGVENNGDLVCGRGCGCFGSEFGLHAA